MNAVKGLTVSNVVVIALLAIIAIPVYTIWKALNDEKIMDRLMSTYEEIAQPSGCTLRHAKRRGGPDQWSIASGFAFQGIDRWHVSVVMDHPPTEDELVSYCASLKLIGDRMLDRGSADPGGDGGHPAEVLPGSVPGAPADGSGHEGNMSAPSQEAPAEEEAR
jgi:hypothetical protein